jgi:DNA (cytosine-5)-methyltransferase 1
MKFIDLCCGAGGMSLGFIMAGHECVAAFDSDPVAVATHNLNLGEHAHVADIKTLTELPDADCIIGGPPCQALSKGNQINGGWHSERNLVPAFINIVLAKRPTYFVMENVQGILAHELELAKLNHQLFAAGYLVNIFQVDAANYGVPQNRKRVFIIGSKKFVTFPEPTHRHKKISVRTAIGKMLEAEEHTPPFMKPFLGHPDKMVHPSNRPVRGKTNFGKRELYWRSIDRPSFTILAREQGGSKARVVIGEKSYPVEPYHNAVLQSFPASFKFPTQKGNATRLIGNAVPPLLAYRIGDCLND